MIFITKNNIIELSNWGLQGIEIFSDSTSFHEILNPLFSIKKDDERYLTVKQEIEKQIKAHPSYLDLREMQI